MRQESLWLTSSHTSRTAATLGSSSGSIPPPGTIHLSGCRLLLTNNTCKWEPIYSETKTSITDPTWSCHCGCAIQHVDFTVIAFKPESADCGGLRYSSSEVLDILLQRILDHQSANWLGYIQLLIYWTKRHCQWIGGLAHYHIASMETRRLAVISQLDHRWST